MNLPDKIKEIRTLKNLTQEDLANACCVTRSTISNWEAGRRKPDWESLIIIADLFNISIGELLGKENVQFNKEKVEEEKEKTETNIKQEKILPTFLPIINSISIFLIITLLLISLWSAVNGKYNKFNKATIYDIEFVSLNIKMNDTIDIYYFNELNDEISDEKEIRNFKICDLLIDQSKFLKYQYCHDLLCILDISIQYSNYNVKSKFDGNKYIKLDLENNMIDLLNESNTPFITKPGTYDFTLAISNNLYYIGAFMK